MATTNGTENAHQPIRGLQESRTSNSENFQPTPHQRRIIHRSRASLKEPFRCLWDDCKAKMDDWDTFYDHIHQSHLHVRTRCMWYKCEARCQTGRDTIAWILRHFQTIHMQHVYDAYGPCREQPNTGPETTLRKRTADNEQEQQRNAPAQKKRRLLPTSRPTVHMKQDQQSQQPQSQQPQPSNPAEKRRKRLSDSSGDGDHDLSYQPAQKKRTSLSISRPVIHSTQDQQPQQPLLQQPLPQQPQPNEQVERKRKRPYESFADVEHGQQFNMPAQKKRKPLPTGKPTLPLKQTPAQDVVAMPEADTKQDENHSPPVQKKRTSLPKSRPLLPTISNAAAPSETLDAERKAKTALKLITTPDSPATELNQEQTSQSPGTPRSLEELEAWHKICKRPGCFSETKKVALLKDPRSNAMHPGNGKEFVFKFHKNKSSSLPATSPRALSKIVFKTTSLPATSPRGTPKIVLKASSPTSVSPRVLPKIIKRSISSAGPSN
ncbi:hypothetical protein B0T17DRAFT_615069 [Bombardia bombarda]|uniref:Uncharacterized protein n=1 Tax=Bombardia bombarda TaxID=252184 RepID=A0AA39X8H2_9PEZI|nr:hypothetical protein B0T17DRAFT_615069 [Bombardia bombarda]